ncbi:MAG: hypothetical protein KatS3mg015_2490 [Fimbriimonadales bacterium]|nr:MAG: hypothetical protein KatS3mg015_2490 [Fimbriimonadales bacterium]
MTTTVACAALNRDLAQYVLRAATFTDPGDYRYCGVLVREGVAYATNRYKACAVKMPDGVPDGYYGLDAIRAMRKLRVKDGIQSIPLSRNDFPEAVPPLFDDARGEGVAGLAVLTARFRSDRQFDRALNLLSQLDQGDIVVEIPLSGKMAIRPRRGESNPFVDSAKPWVLDAVYDVSGTWNDEYVAPIANPAFLADVLRLVGPEHRIYVRGPFNAMCFEPEYEWKGVRALLMGMKSDAPNVDWNGKLIARC